MTPNPYAPDWPRLHSRLGWSRPCWGLGLSARKKQPGMFGLPEGLLIPAASSWNHRSATTPGTTRLIAAGVKRRSNSLFSKSSRREIKRSKTTGLSRRGQKIDPSPGRERSALSRRTRLPRRDFCPGSLALWWTLTDTCSIQLLEPRLKAARAIPARAHQHPLTVHTHTRGPTLDSKVRKDANKHGR